MLRTLLEKYRNKPSRGEYAIPEGRVIYAVGDIHGRADLLHQLHELISAHALKRRPEKKMLVYLGDYVDRGPQVRETLDMLASKPLPGFERRFLMGNHEQFLLHFLEDPLVLETWAAVGGQATLLSYAVNSPGSGFSPERAGEVLKQFRQALPGRHLEFLRSLEPYFKMGDYLFVHAGIRPGLALEKQKPEDIYWIRDEFLSCSLDLGCKVVHGHTIEEKILIRANRIGIDTGAYATGVLSCAVVEGSGLDFLSTGS